MRVTGVTIGLLAALLGTTALAQAQDYSGSVSGSAGVVVLSLPSVPSGISGTGDIDAPGAADDLAIGITFGASGVLNLAPVGGSNAFVGFSAFGTMAQGNSSNASTLSGSGALVIPGYSTPTDFSISLTTNSTGGGGNVSANSTTSQGAGPETNNANLAAGTGAAYGWGVNPGNGANVPSFLYGGYFADSADDRSAAFGAVADEDGNIFIGVGDLTGVVVTNDVQRSVAYLGGDLTIGLSGEAGGGTTVSGFVGPSYRFLGQDIASQTTADLPEAGTGAVVGGGAGVEFPFYRLSRDENLDSHYLGGVIGGSLSTPVSDTMIFNLSGRAGIYSVNTSFTGSETASVFGGNPAPTTDPTEVANLNTVSLSDTGVGYSADAQASLTMPLDENKQISFGGGVGYLSRVASIDRGAGASVDTSAYGSGDDDGSVGPYTTTENLAPTLTFGDMWSFSGFVTFSGRF